MTDQQKQEITPCPVCSGNWGGVGVANGKYRKGTKERHYLKCSTCGHSWWYDSIVQIVEVNFREPKVDFQEDFSNQKNRSRSRRSK